MSLKMSKTCPACGATLETGLLIAQNRNPLEPFATVNELTFVRPGAPTSPNPVSAFLQGMREEPSKQTLAVSAFRCTGCGRIELYAEA
jgi:hypothetical protein